MKVCFLLPLAVGWLALVPCASALEFPDVLGPLRGAARFVAKFVPSFGGEKGDAETSAPDEAAAAAEVDIPGTVPQVAATEPSQVVGTVRFAYENFVLIYTPLKTSLPAGTKVTTVGQDGAPGGAQLSMSTERKGAFLVADVVSGQPRSGDLVVTVPDRKGRALADYQVLD